MSVRLSSGFFGKRTNPLLPHGKIAFFRFFGKRGCAPLREHGKFLLPFGNTRRQFDINKGIAPERDQKPSGDQSPSHHVAFPQDAVCHAGDPVRGRLEISSAGACLMHSLLCEARRFADVGAGGAQAGSMVPGGKCFGGVRLCTYWRSFDIAPRGAKWAAGGSSMECGSRARFETLPVGRGANCCLEVARLSHARCQR